MSDRHGATFLEKVERVVVVSSRPKDEAHNLAFMAMHRLIERGRQSSFSLASITSILTLRIRFS